MIISLIAAVSRNSVIGRNNDMPWHLPDDTKYFMETTMGHAVIMGRKNYDSLPKPFKPLKGRQNILVTRQVGLQAPGVAVVHSFEEGLETAARLSGEKEVFVIGGAEIYKVALPHAQRLYMTEIDATIDGDTFFPAFNKKEWTERRRSPHPRDERHAYAFEFVLYERKN